MERKLVVWLAVGLIILAVTILTQGLLYSPGHLSTDQSKERGRFLDPLWEAYQKTEANYYRPEQVDRDRLIREALRGLIRGLEDPYSRFNTKEEYERFSTELEGEYEGIGAYIGLRKGEVVIIAPLKGGPAEREGIRAGDVILEIDGESTQGFTMDDAARRLRGPHGTSVVVKVRHLDGTVEEITIVRERIRIPSVEHKLIETSVAYVRLNTFSKTTSGELRRALEEMQKESPSIEGIILDLRGNGGGLLQSAKEVASFFIDQGAILIERGRFGERVHRSFGNRLPNWPIAVLVDGGTASASEIVAGAIRDQKMGVLIGRRTFGKGVIQTPIDLSDGSVLILTTAEYFTPQGHPVQEVGLEPDIPVEDWYPVLIELLKDLEALEGSLPEFAQISRQVLQGFDGLLGEIEERARQDEYEAALEALDELARRLQMSPDELLLEAGAPKDDPEVVLIGPLLEKLAEAFQSKLVELRSRLERNDLSVALEWLHKMQGRLCPCELDSGASMDDDH